MQKHARGAAETAEIDDVHEIAELSQIHDGGSPRERLSLRTTSVQRGVFGRDARSFGTLAEAYRQSIAASVSMLLPDGAVRAYTSLVLPQRERHASGRWR